MSASTNLVSSIATTNPITLQGVYMDANSNTLRRIAQSPDVRKWGVMSGACTGTSNGSGIFAQGFYAAASGTGYAYLDSTDGTAAQYTSGGTSGNSSGAYYPNPWTLLNWNPRLKIGFKLGTVTNNRAFIGFTSYGPTDFSGEEPLPSLYGVGILQRSTDTNFQLVSNNGAASSTIIAPSTTVAITANHFNTVDIIGSATNGNFLVSINGNPYDTISTPIPSATTGLNCRCCLQQSATEAGHIMQIHYIVGGSDK